MSHLKVLWILTVLLGASAGVKAEEGELVKSIRVVFNSGVDTRYLVNDNGVVTAPTELPKNNTGLWRIVDNAIQSVSTPSLYLYVNSGFKLGSEAKTFTFSKGVMDGTQGIATDNRYGAVKSDGSISGGQFTGKQYNEYNGWSSDFIIEDAYAYADDSSGQPSTDPNITFSTDAEQHWYYIYSVSEKDYCRGKVWLYNADNDRMMFGDKAFMSDRIWSFWKNSSGKIAIKNYNGVYVGKAGSGSGGSTQFGKSSSANYIYQIDCLTAGQFTISDGGVPLHAQDAGSVLVRWEAEVNNASTWNFQEVDVTNATAVLASTCVEQGKVTTGIGNQNVPILRSTVNVGGLEGSVSFDGVAGKILATQLSDVKAVRAYFATNSQELFVDPDKKMSWRSPNAELFGEGTLNADGTYTVKGVKKLAPGTYYLWIALDISDDAKEGNSVDATIASYDVDAKSIIEKVGNPQYAATIFLSEGSVLMPMDKGSLYYRIPAICTSADGKRLVTLTDDRKNHNADLPSHCYVVAQYSEDLGKTWSNPVTVAGTSTTGGDYGHGDASLITNRITGEIIGIMTTSANGNGYFGSTPDKPQTWKTIKSKDGGKTWSVPKDHTKSLYGTGSPNPNWLGGFTGSGAGLQKRDGTLVSPFVNRESPDGTNTDVTQNYYNFMSKDGGETWYVSGVRGSRPCDEPKVLERNNGDLAISVRQSGYNLYNVTSDDGMSWKYGDAKHFTTGISGNACDGEYMYWCSTLDGNPWNIVFQTLPNSGSRQNLSIALSEDEGETFGAAKTICPRGSAYSAATVLPDGTVGVYYEENGLYGGYTMRFVRFSLDWASDGKFVFTQDAPFHPIQTKVSVSVPTYGQDKDADGQLTGLAVGTIVLPFSAEVPTEMTVYECTSETFSLIEGGKAFTGTVLKKYDGNLLEPFHPYVFTAANDALFVFERPLSEWVAQTMPAECLSQSGFLTGWFVNEPLSGDGINVYSDVRYISSKGGLVFNRITAGRNYNVPAYGASYTGSFTATNSPDAVRVFTPGNCPDAISSVSAKSISPTAMFELNGRKILAMPSRGVVVKEGRKHVLK